MESALPVWVSPPFVAVTIATALTLAWRAARAVARVDPGDPTLPERVQQWRGQHQAVAAVAIAVLLFSGVHALWAIPAVWLGLQAVAHRVRRSVFGDTWSLAGQIGWNLRVLAGTAGVWWVLAFAPLGLLAVSAPAWVTVAVGGLLLAWNHFAGDVVLRALAATPLDRPGLAAAFEPVLARTTVPRPRLMRAGPRGALLANAFAMSSVRGDVVLFFDGILDRAAPAEIAAILAHELGHLEDFASRRAGLYAHGAVLAAGVPLVTLAIQHARLPAWAALVWLAGAVGSLLARAIRSQQRETASDRRAVELCGGDGEALVRGLVTLHALGFVPRRFDPDIERQATHPSLARRIAAIRAASGVAPAAIEPKAFPADADPSRAVVFEADRLVFVTSDTAPDLADPTGLVLHGRKVDAIRYADLTELRLEPHPSGAVLVAADRAGTRRRVALAAADVAAAQALMDVADQRMTAAPVSRPLPVLGRVAALASVVALLVTVSSVLFAALMACVRPTMPILAAVAAGSLVTAVLPGQHLPRTQTLALVLTGLACAATALQQRRAARRSETPFAWDGLLIVQLAIVALVALAPAAVVAALGYRDAADLHAAARAFATAAAGSAALGAFLFAIPRRPARIASGVPFALCAAILTAASDPFRDRVVSDPLVADAPPLPVEDIRGAPLERLTLGGTHGHLRLAPDARHVLLTAAPGDGSSRVIPHVVAGFDGWRRSFTATEAHFADAATLLTVRSDGNGRVLTAESVREGTVRWTLRLENAPAGRLELGADGAWRVASLMWFPLEERPTQLDGRIGEPGVRATAIAPWTTPSPIQSVVSYGVTAGGDGVAVMRHFRGLDALGSLLPDRSWSSEIFRVGARGRASLAHSRLAVQCFGPGLARADAICLAKTGDETFVWRVPATSGPLRIVARTDGVLTAAGTSLRGETLLAWRDRELLLLWPGQPRAIRVANFEACPCPHDADASAGRLATLTSEPDRSIVSLYALAPPAAPVRASAAARD